MVGDFHLVRVSVLPNETDAILVVDSDAVLALPVTLQGLQSVAGNPARIAKGFRLIQLDQLTKSSFFDQLKLLRGLLPKDSFSRSAPKGRNFIVYRYTTNRKAVVCASAAPTARNAPPAPGRKSSPPRSPRRAAARAPWDSAHPALPSPYTPDVRSSTRSG